MQLAQLSAICFSLGLFAGQDDAPPDNCFEGLRRMKSEPVSLTSRKSEIMAGISTQKDFSKYREELTFPS